MGIDWNTLRTLDGSQPKAFEELCCQLAARESAPQGSTFVRLAAPDAGVECYWTLPNGDEWGWQAKFFTSPPTENQWKELDKSVKTAFEEHPRLTSYAVCFPLDRQDPRLEKQLWFMDKWNRRVEKWQRWAQAKKRNVEFPYWGEHEIFLRLSREEHRGRYFFWFNKELFSEQWFKERLDEAIANAGPRYTPELNVELPIARLFDGLGRTTAFFDRFDARVLEVKKAWREAVSRSVRQAAPSEYNTLEQRLTALLDETRNAKKNIGPIEWHTLVKSCGAVYKAIQTCTSKLEEVAREQKDSESDEKQQRQRDGFSNNERSLRHLREELYELAEPAESDEARLTNLASLLLVGNAGTGKTHLFCDVAEQRLRNKRPTVLLLGEQFRDAEPWSQMISLLGLSCDRDQFLGALNTAGEVRDQRCLLFIDALNEGEGKRFWNQHLAGMLTTLSRYPWLGIAISVRSSYKDLIVPDSLVPARLCRTVHAGFANHEYEATKTFFDYYGIERPSIPLLTPEFQNPLFLKLFCKGLQAGGHTRISEGLQGLTAIFDFFIENLNEKLARPEQVGFNPKAELVQKAIDKLTETMAERSAYWLPHQEAQTIVDQVLPPQNYEDSLFRRLIVEGLLAEDRFPLPAKDKQKYKYEEGIRFAYERLSDHLIVQHLLAKHLSSEAPQRAFKPNQPLGKLIADEQACWRNQGVIEALSIQLPECLRKELGELAPKCADYRAVREAFVESLLWRSPDSITRATLEYARAHALRYRDTDAQSIQVVLTVATNPAHPYNADFLHRNLMHRSLPDRDAWWSILLHEQYTRGDASPVTRLIDWAWKTEDKSYIQDESIRLAGTALSWFLTTSNRFLRDRATKALVSLLTDRLYVLRQILTAFIKVDDPYVSERLYAVAYGCALRSTSLSGIRELAQDVYDQIFRKGAPPPNILLRDYARGVIELALHYQLDLKVNPKKIRPPYKSTWPKRIPSAATLKKFDNWRDGMPDEERSRLWLYESVMGFGDFARYIIGTNFPSFAWSSRPLRGPRNSTRKETYQGFVSSLTEPQKRAFERYEQALNHLRLHQLAAVLEQAKRGKLQESGLPQGSKLEEDLHVSKQALRKILNQKSLKIFETKILSYLNNPQKDEHDFDLSLIQRWTLQKVIALGWTVERFGHFDRNVNSWTTRETEKPERIGKKYQWIAYHEILARVADNFEYRGRYREDELKQYTGPWQVGHVRNIDPSFLLEQTKGDRWQPTTKTWWSPLHIEDYGAPSDDAAWLCRAKDLPAPPTLITVINPSDSSEWLTLSGYFKWKQPVPPEEEGVGLQGREVWYIVESYLVKKMDFKETLEWAKTQNFFRRRIPEPQDVHNVFFGELFRSPAYLHRHDSFREYAEWTLGEENLLPHPIMVTSERYVWERGYDCSIENTIGICVPSRYLAEHMNLRWNGVEGVFSNSADETMAFDPSVQEKGPSTLLIRKDVLVDFLEKNDLSVLWILRGEKNAYGRHPWAERFLGRLYVSGAYNLSKKGNVEGVLNSVFEPPDSGKDGHSSTSFSQANHQSRKPLKTSKDQAERNSSTKE